jgi:hypothetical protein
MTLLYESGAQPCRQLRRSRAASRCRRSKLGGAALDHAPGVDAVHGFCRERAGAAKRRSGPGWPSGAMIIAPITVAAEFCDSPSVARPALRIGIIQNGSCHPSLRLKKSVSKTPLRTSEGTASENKCALISRMYRGSYRRVISCLSFASLPFPRVLPVRESCMQQRRPTNANKAPNALEHKVCHGTEKCLAAVKDDLELCRRCVDRRHWRRGVLLLVCRPSIESPHARPSHGNTRPFPWAAARRRTATRMAFRAERRGRLRRQVWMRETII